MINLNTEETWPKIASGKPVQLTGKLITCRDGVLHKIFMQEEQLCPTFFQDALIYFCGPSPAPPGKIIGSCGPTTSSRMEPYFEQLCNAGIKGIMGKGQISDEAAGILRHYGVTYFAGIGGAGALLSTKVTASKIIAYPELGTEAVYELKVKDFPAVVS